MSDYNDYEHKESSRLFKAFALAQFVVIAICYLIYFNYLLLGQFFFCFFFAFVTSISLRPYKKLIKEELESTLGKSKYILQTSLIYKILKEAYLTVHCFIKTLSPFQAIKLLITRLFNHVLEFLSSRKQRKTTFFNDFWTISVITLIYLAIFYIGLQNSFAIFVKICCAIFIIKFMIFFFVFVMRRLGVI